MAGQYSRQTPLEQTREPHSVSLKVLKLARPGLTQQFPFPSSTSQQIDPRAALSYPSSSDHSFILSPLLSLPRGPATAFVGELFSTLICVNNELPDPSDRDITSLKVEAEMQTPTHTEPLDIILNSSPIGDSGLRPGETAQRTVKFDLREDGVHVLSITITYSERFTPKGESSPSGGRVRSFKKLYNLNAAPCLSVRTKASLVKRGETKENYALEAQLENLAEGIITLEDVTFEPKPYYKSTSLNWNVSGEKHGPPSLSPREVTQVMFLLESTSDEKETTPDGRTKLGYLSVRWRGAMGEPGFLSTGELASRRR